MTDRPEDAACYIDLTLPPPMQVPRRPEFRHSPGGRTVSKPENMCCILPSVFADTTPHQLLGPFKVAR